MGFVTWVELDRRADEPFPYFMQRVRKNRIPRCLVREEPVGREITYQDVQPVIETNEAAGQ